MNGSRRLQGISAKASAFLAVNASVHRRLTMAVDGGAVKGSLAIAITAALVGPAPIAYLAGSDGWNPIH